MRIVLLWCVALATLSLLLPSEPTYDPWAWIVWGREIAFLDLDTAGGPSWKPLPVLFTFFFAPLGKVHDGIPPALWLVVARVGTLLAMVMAFRVARRLAGPGRATGIGAGLVAATALALSPQWLRYAAHGNEAPLAVALMLWGMERHLDGERSHALVLGFLACLLRPEVFPFLAAYGVWLWFAEPQRRRLAVGLGVALPLLWLAPEWAGSGNPLSAGAQARSEPSWSLSLTDRPWLEAIERAHTLLGLEIEIAVVAAAVLALVRRELLVVGLAGAIVLWIGLVAAMTQAGFSGNARYFLPAMVLACVLAGVGAARLAEVAGRPPATVAVALALAFAASPYVDRRVDVLVDQAEAAKRVAGLHRDLRLTVRAAGGPEGVVARGVPLVNRAFITQLAWETKLPIALVERADGRGLVFDSRARGSGVAAAVPQPPVPMRRVAGTVTWGAYEAQNVNELP